MFDWLKNLFKKKSEGMDIYHPKERFIYKYFDGQHITQVDPLVIYERYLAVQTELSIDLRVMSSESKDAGKAKNSVVEKIRGIFKVKSYEEGGLVQTELFELLDHFLEFTEGVKKNSSPLLTSPKETLPSSNSSLVDGQTMLNSSPIGSTEKESGIDAPVQSPTEHPLPLGI